MEIGVVGKPNVGKSTLFNALTLLDSPMAPYPFTTVKPHRGTAAVRVPCPHTERGTECTPGNAKCVNGVRWIPVTLIDVPGLVPGAHEGKGLGHQFLDDLRPSDGFLHVVDASGGSGPDGSPAPPGSFDPADEVAWLGDELVHWIAGILGRDFSRATKAVELEGAHLEEFLAQRLTGLSIPVPALSSALRSSGLDRAHPSKWTKDDLFRLGRALLEVAKPRLIAGNKADRVEASTLDDLRGRVAPLPVVGTSAESELTLRRAARAGLVSYAPGDREFSIPDPGRLNAAQLHALEEIRRTVRRYGTTGVQASLESLVFDRLGLIAVFPVEDETRWTDSRGRVLPDAFLVPAATPVRDIAYRVHTALGEGFIRAIDGRSHRAMGADQPLEHRSVVRIVART
jgi:ribosome-binding ATPase